MLTRRDAEFAKDGTEDSRNLEIPLRVSTLPFLPPASDICVEEKC